MNDPTEPVTPAPDTTPPGADPMEPPFEGQDDQEGEKYDGGPIPGTTEPVEGAED